MLEGKYGRKTHFVSILRNLVWFNLLSFLLIILSTLSLDENDNIELMPTYIHHSVLNATPVYLPHGKPMQTSWVYSNLYGGGQKVFWCVLPGLPGNTIDANT